MTILKARATLADKGLGLPEFLSLKYDNTGREGKNQIVAKWMSWIQHAKVFRQVQDGSGEPGHSHDALDQRFSIIAAHLAECKVLQEPMDVVRNIRQKTNPIRGRKVGADILSETWNWEEFFAPLQVKMSGIAASPAHPDVCFSKRVLALADLPELRLPDWELEVPEMFRHLERDPRDIVMLCKQEWTSPTLAQPPLLWIPHALFGKLDVVPRIPNMRRPLSERMIREYKKTAQAVIAQPWGLHRAGAYLEAWVSSNVAGAVRAPPKLDALPTLARLDWSPGIAVEWRDYAPAPPVRIAVQPAPQKRVQPAPKQGAQPAPKKRTALAPKRTALAPTAPAPTAPAPALPAPPPPVSVPSPADSVALPPMDFGMPPLILAAQKAARCRKAASPKCATAPPTVKTGLKADVRDEKSRKQFVCRLEQASDGDKKFSTFTVKYGIGKQYSTWQEAKEFTEIWRKAQALTTA